MLPLPPPPVPSGAANFGTAALCLVSLTPRLSVAWGGVGGVFFSQVSFSMSQAGN